VSLLPVDHSGRDRTETAEDGSFVFQSVNPAYYIGVSMTSQGVG
jgi:hypothetical protein